MIKLRTIVLLWLAGFMPGCMLFDSYPTLLQQGDLTDQGSDAADQLVAFDLMTDAASDRPSDLDPKEDANDLVAIDCVAELLHEHNARKVGYDRRWEMSVPMQGQVVAQESEETGFRGHKSGANSSEWLRGEMQGSFFFRIELEEKLPTHAFGLSEVTDQLKDWSFLLFYRHNLAESIPTPSLTHGEVNGGAHIIFSDVEKGDIVQLGRDERGVFAKLFSARECAWRGRDEAFFKEDELDESTYRFPDPWDPEKTYRAALRYSGYHARLREAEADASGLRPVVEGAPFISTTIWYACARHCDE